MDESYGILEPTRARAHNRDVTHSVSSAVTKIIGPVSSFQTQDATAEWCDFSFVTQRELSSSVRSKLSKAIGRAVRLTMRPIDNGRMYITLRVSKKHSHPTALRWIIITLVVCIAVAVATVVYRRLTH